MSAESSPTESRRLERRALVASAVGYLFMAALGIAFSLATRSEAILLDGVYSLVSFAAALGAYRVAKLVTRPGTVTFNFGFAHLEPLVNAARGVLILGIAAFALVSAMDALLHGGRPITAGLALAYGMGAAAMCLFMAWLQRRLSRRVGSPLLHVDARNWFVDGLLSVGAAVAFLLAFLLEGSSAEHLVPYVDPVLVTVMVLVASPVPVLTIWENFREVLQIAPAKDRQEEVRSRVQAALEDLPAREIQVRMVKTGRFFYVMTHVVMDPDWQPPRLADVDELRCRVARALEDVPLRLVTDTVFTSDEHWTLMGDDRDCAE